jgi:hypothetical protein
MMVEKVGKLLIEYMDDFDNDDDFEFNVEEPLHDLLLKKNKEGYWVARVKNFGWRSLDGSAFFRLDSAKDVFWKVLPQTDCHFRIFNFGKGFAIQNYHHDSPMGNEWYYLLPATKKQIESEDIEWK